MLLISTDLIDDSGDIIEMYVVKQNYVIENKDPSCKFFVMTW